jgi:hypothetical protein
MPGGTIDGDGAFHMERAIYVALLGRPSGGGVEWVRLRHGRGLPSDGSDAVEPPEIKSSDMQPKGAPFQYSLRTMLIVMTVLAVALSGIFAGPPWASTLTGLLLSLLATMVLTVGIIYGRGYGRTFCIGGLFPAALILIAYKPDYMDLVRAIGWQDYYGTFGSPDEILPWRVALSIFVAGVMIVVSGLVAMGVRWMMEGSQRRREREAFLLRQILRRQPRQTSGLTAPTTPES